MTVRVVVLLVAIVGAGALAGAAVASAPAQTTALDGSANATVEAVGSVGDATAGVDDGTSVTVAEDAGDAVDNVTESTATETAAVTGTDTGETDTAVEDATDATDDVVENATDATEDPVDTVTDGTDAVDDVTGNVTGNVTDEIDDATDDVTGDVTDTIDNVTVDVAGEATIESDAADGVSIGVDADATVETDGGENESVGGSEAGGSTSTGSATRSNATADPGAAAGPAPPSGGEGRGGDLPGAAGGAAAVGLTLAVGAGLLNRSAQVATSAPAATWDFHRLAATTGERLAAAPREWSRWLLGIGGYSRYDDSDPLAHDTRAALHRRIEASPGVYLSEIAEAEGVPISTARHHLRILESDTLVRSSMIRGRRRYFPAGTDNPELEAALAEGTQAAILEQLSSRGRASVSTLAEELDRDASTITYHAQRLAEAGLVTRARDGQVVWNRLSPDVRAYFEAGVASAHTD